MKIKFPMERSVYKKGETNQEGAANLGVLLMQSNVSIVYRPWIYLALGALVMPLGIAFFAMKPRR